MISYFSSRTYVTCTTKQIIIKQTLEHASNIAPTWFTKNFMKANPSKFQAICFSKSGISIQYEMNGIIIECEKVVKPLGVNIHSKLLFEHVAKICKKAARQVNILQRLCKYLDYDTKVKIYE